MQCSLCGTTVDPEIEYLERCKNKPGEHVACSRCLDQPLEQWYNGPTWSCTQCGNDSARAGGGGVKKRRERERAGQARRVRKRGRPKGSVSIRRVSGNGEGVAVQTGAAKAAATSSLSMKEGRASSAVDLESATPNSGARAPGDDENEDALRQGTTITIFCMRDLRRYVHHRHATLLRQQQEKHDAELAKARKSINSLTEEEQLMAAIQASMNVL